MNLAIRYQKGFSTPNLSSFVVIIPERIFSLTYRVDIASFSDSSVYPKSPIPPGYFRCLGTLA